MTPSAEARRLNTAVVAVLGALPSPSSEPTWGQRSESALWYELGACILGSRVRYEVSLAAARALRAAGPLASPPPVSELPTFQHRASAVLTEPLVLRGGRAVRYPFPYARAHQLRRTAEVVYGRGQSIKWLLSSNLDPRSARAVLVDRACGVGPKQASMFLRNIGFTHSLAVIDTHVLRYLSLVGHCCLPTRSGIGSLRTYESIESRLRRIAEEFGTVPGRLDTAIWVVMRLVPG